MTEYIDNVTTLPQAIERARWPHARIPRPSVREALARRTVIVDIDGQPTLWIAGQTIQGAHACALTVRYMLDAPPGERVAGACWRDAGVRAARGADVPAVLLALVMRGHDTWRPDWTLGNYRDALDASARLLTMIEQGRA